MFFCPTTTGGRGRRCFHAHLGDPEATCKTRDPEVASFCPSYAQNTWPRSDLSVMAQSAISDGYKRRKAACPPGPGRPRCPLLHLPCLGMRTLCETLRALCKTFRGRGVSAQDIQAAGKASQRKNFSQQQQRENGGVLQMAFHGCKHAGLASDVVLLV